MKIDDLIKQCCEWLKGTGPHANILLSSRIRIARNLDKVRFVHWASKKESKNTLETIESAIRDSNYMKGSLILNMTELSELDSQFLVERNLISKEHLINPEYKGVGISQKEVVSIMINEEDHLRIQVMQSGFNLMECWRIARQIEDELSKNLKFAFMDELGYLTACPTNTGTGLRASVMLHLPALAMTRQIPKILQAITKLGLTARGLYGEGTEAQGNFFQVSNQITLGPSEEDIIDNIERIIRQILSHEEAARKSILKQSKDALQDKIFRADGILKRAHIITSSETIELLSMVRLGIDLGFIKDIDRRAVNELFIITQPAHLQKIEGRNLATAQRDIKRAELIRRVLEGK